jgi:hypothetical protein
VSCAPVASLRQSSLGTGGLGNPHSQSQVDRSQPVFDFLQRRFPEVAYLQQLVVGSSDKTGASPQEDPMHPMELLATIYHAFGIDPETIVLNHLKQPRELVKAKAVTKLFA